MFKQVVSKIKYYSMGFLLITHKRVMLVILMLLVEIIGATFYWIFAGLYKSVLDSITQGDINDLYWAFIYLFLILIMMCIVNPIISNQRDRIILLNKKSIYKHTIQTILSAGEKEITSVEKEDLLIRMTNDSEAISDIMIAYEKILFSVLYFIVSMVGIIWIDYRFLLIYLPFSIIFVIVSNKMGDISGKYSGRYRESTQIKLKALVNVAKGIETIRSFRMNEFMRSKFESYLVDQKSIVFDEISSSKTMYSLNQLLNSFLDIGMTVFGIILASIGLISLGSVVALNQFQNGIINLFFTYGDNVRDLNMKLLKIHKISQTIQLNEKPNIIDDKIIDLTRKIELQISNLTFRYPGNTEDCLCNLNVSINDYGIYLINAESGYGKTTLFKLILGLYIDYSGAILLNGVEMKDVSLAKWRKHFCWMPQNPKLISGLSIKENIESGCDISIDKINNVLHLLGLEDSISALPDGINTIVSDEGTLSVGQMQRVALARVLLSDSPILLLDEPTSALDQVTIYKLFDILRDVASNKVVVIASHDKNIVKIVNDIIKI